MPYNDKLDYYRFISDKKYNKQMIEILRKNNRNIRSSLLDDIERGEKTEIEFLLGAMYNYSSRSKSRTPYINAIYSMIKNIECGKRRVCKNAFCDDIFDDIEDDEDDD